MPEISKTIEVSHGFLANETFVNSMRQEHPELAELVLAQCVACSTAWLRAYRGLPVEDCTGRKVEAAGGSPLVGTCMAGVNVHEVDDGLQFDQPRLEYGWSLASIGTRKTFIVLEHLMSYRPQPVTSEASRKVVTAKSFLRLVNPRSSLMTRTLKESGYPSFRPRVEYSPAELGLVVRDRSEVGYPPLDHAVKSPNALDERHSLAVQAGSFLEFISRYRQEQLDSDFRFTTAEEDMLMNFERDLQEQFGEPQA